MDQFRYVKIQPKPMDPSTKLQKITAEFVGFSSPAPRAVVSFAAVFRDVGQRSLVADEVYCIKLNFNNRNLAVSS